MWYNWDAEEEEIIGYSKGVIDKNDFVDNKYIYSEYQYNSLSDDEKKKEQYKDKYCIQWYKKTNNQSEAPDIFAGSDWVHLDTYLNKGLPPIEEKDGDYTWPAFPDLDTCVCELELDSLSTSTTYKAILFYNHIAYPSEEIVLTNNQ
jgi:hypothetical protein